MKVLSMPDADRYPTMLATKLRDSFLIESLFQSVSVQLMYCDADRAIIGSAIPTASPLPLGIDADLRADFFCQRRELGVLNIGGAGSVTVDGKKHAMGSLDGLYVGRGSRDISFASDDPKNPAAFYLLSYPAHADYPTTHASKSSAAAVQLGSVAAANRRTIFKYIHPDGIKSCQLVMGFTLLDSGSVWNTMPAHTHLRRSEVYLYFNVPADARVLHLMGTPNETRHLFVADRQVVVSPSWSIHSGCGTGAYSFCWGMGGENQAFDDMDPAPLVDMR